MIKRIITIFFSFLLPVVCVWCQHDKNTDFRIDKRLPSVYLSFEKFGPRKPRYPSESEQGVWLRLNNNSCWEITVKTFGVTSEYGDVGLFYDVRRDLRSSNDLKVPVGYRIADISSVRTLKPGGSLVFSIPREHLVPGLYILVGFSYEWELHGDSGGGVLEIVHSVGFLAADLPSDPKIDKKNN